MHRAAFLTYYDSNSTVSSSSDPVRPLVLSMGMADPVSALGIQADLITFNTLQCYGLSVPTALAQMDSASISQIHAMDADSVTENARLLLEDMHVAAFKIGLPASVENLSALAEIISDYNQLPFVLDPFCSSLPGAGHASDDIIIGMRDLLIPQASLLLLSKVQLEQLALTWRTADEDTSVIDDVHWLLEHGCGHVLVSGLDDPNSPAGSAGNTLFGPEGILRHDSWPRLPGKFLGAGACLSAAITAMLAHKQPLSHAVLQAQLYTANALSHARRYGMGKLLPARHLLPSALFEPDTEILEFEDEAAPSEHH